MKYSKHQLVNEYQRGKKLKYLFFWGHKKNRNGKIDSACFSQWYQVNFEVDGHVYPTTEHYMMAEKARLFNDNEALNQILNASSPGEAKSIGRQVRGFNQETWDKHRLDIVVKGNFHKFNQNKSLKEFLLNTKNRILVEASPVDSIWGIGLDKEHEFASVPVKWKGLNLLGFALMEVRDMLEPS